MTENIEIWLPQNVDAILIARLSATLSSAGYTAKLELARRGRGKRMRLVGTPVPDNADGEE